MIGIAALVLSIIGFVFACVPGALVIGWVLLPLAFILGIVGLFLSGKTKGTSISAVTISAIGAVVGVTVFLVVVQDALKDAFGDSKLSPSAANHSPSTQGGSASSPENKGGDAGTREKPLPIGATVTNRDWEVTLGNPREAGAEIAAENQFNKPPEAGMEYWIVPVTATYTGDNTGSPLVEIRVDFVGSDNRTYNGYDCSVVIPDPLNNVGQLYKGGVAKGNKCVIVPASLSGLWAVSTGVMAKPVFFEGK